MLATSTSEAMVVERFAISARHDDELFEVVDTSDVDALDDGTGVDGLISNPTASCSSTVCDSRMCFFSLQKTSRNDTGPLQNE